MDRSFAVLCWVALLGLAGCAGAPEETPPEPTEPSSGAQTLPIPSTSAPVHESGSSVDVGPLTWDVPAGWTTVTPSSSMRIAQFEASGSAGTGECAVFYFGPGQGGEPLANAQRWAGQFSQPDGSSSIDKMKVSELDGGALGLTLVEVTGTYDGGMSTGTAPAESMAGYMMLGGIASGPDAPWFFKFTGPQATVEENRGAFIALLRSIRQEI